VRPGAMTFSERVENQIGRTVDLHGLEQSANYVVREETAAYAAS